MPFPSPVDHILFIRRTDAGAEAPILWPPGAKSWLIGKDLEAGKDWGQEKKGATEDETVGWHDPMDMNLSKLQEMVKDREAWHAAVQGVTKCRTWVSNWTRHCREVFALINSTAQSHCVCLCVSWLLLNWKFLPGVGHAGWPLIYCCDTYYPSWMPFTGPIGGGWSAWGHSTGAGLAPLLSVEPRTSPCSLFTSSLPAWQFGLPKWVFPDARLKLLASMVNPTPKSQNSNRSLTPIPFCG